MGGGREGSMYISSQKGSCYIDIERWHSHRKG